MSESEYVNEEMRRFRETLPAGKEWRIYAQHYMNKLGFAGLPHFLKEKHPEAIKKISLAHVLQEKWARQGSVRFDPQDLQLEEGCVKGDLEILWRRSPVHFRFLTVWSGDTMRHGSLIFIAAQSLEAMQDLRRTLYSYDKERARKQKSIKVVGSFNDIPLPNVTWDDICLPPNLLHDIRRSVEGFFSPYAKERYRQFGLAYKRGFLLKGPPGSGKTLCAKIIAATQEQPSIAFIPRETARDSDLLEGAFDLAAQSSPAILILEDIDKFGRSISLSYLLNLLDGLDSPEGILVLATTNRPENVDPALLLRPSRFDRLWTFGLPEYEERLKFLEKRGRGQFARKTLEKIAKNSAGFSMACVQEIFGTAATFGIAEGTEVNDGDLLESFEVLRSQIKNAEAAQSRIGTVSERLGFRA